MTFARVVYCTAGVIQESRVGLRLSAIMIGVACLLTNPAALAADRLCEDADVRIEGQPGVRWADALDRVCADLRSMKDRDTSASIRFIVSEPDLLVEVTLGDGRSAIRRVSRPLALHGALEALLLLPPEPASASPEPAPPEPVRPRETVSPPPLAQAVANPPAPPRSDRLGTAELAFSGVGRVAGNGYPSLGAAAEAYLSTGTWLFGLWARWDAYQHVPAPSELDLETETMGAGVAAARRIDLRAFALDIGFAPRLYVETQSYDRPIPGTDEDEDKTETMTDVRLATFGRALFGRGPIRFFAGVDAEVSPARLRRKVRIDPTLPALPAWSAGISVGVSWTAP